MRRILRSAAVPLAALLLAVHPAAAQSYPDELGDGVPADQDARMRTIVDDVMVPRFRAGDMSGGLRDGVLAVAGAFGAGAAPLPLASPGTYSEPLPARRAPAAGPSDIPSDRGAMPFLLLIVAAAGAGVLGLVSWVRGRKRTCAACKVEMQRVDEKADDVYLDSGRRLEEVLGSVDYTVWQCASCGNHEIRRSARWFSGKESCPQCSYRTVSVDRQTLGHPTYDHGGRQRVAKDCAHCHWHDEDIVHLPRKVRPTPSRSSSFSSSGGGGWSSGSSGGNSRSSGGGSSGGHSSGRGSSGRW
jgi:uncharacterized protein